jgi:hypothetical protein
VTSLVVAGTGTNLKLQAFGKCHPADCDWGVVDAVAHSSGVDVAPARDTEALTAIFDQGFKTAWVILHLRDANTLVADIYSRYKAGDSRPATVSTETFTRGAAAVVTPRNPRNPRHPGGLQPIDRSRIHPATEEDCISFNPRLARAQQIGGRWKVTVGNMMMLDFGANAKDARQALRIIQQYGLEKQCFVGRPDPSLQYFLVGNGVPQGAARGEDCIGFESSKVELKQIQGSWKLVQGSHWLFDFGANAAEGRQALAIIQRYSPNQSCFVGRPDAPMSYLRR